MKDENRDLTIFGNGLNNMESMHLTPKELDFLMSAIHIITDRGVEEIEIPLNIFKSMSIVKGMSNRQFCDAIDDVDSKISQLKFKNTVTGEYERLTIFDHFKSSYANYCVTLRVSPNATYLFNSLERNFTKLSLKTHNALSRKCSKILYRNLSQYRTTGYWEITLDDFKKIFGISDKFPQKMIREKYITPAINELKNIVEIKCTTKKDNTPSHKTEKYIFAFKFLDNADKTEIGVNYIDIPDNRTPDEIKKNAEYREFVKSVLNNKVQLSEYQINFIASKAVSQAVSKEDLEKAINYVLNAKKVNSFMAMLTDAINNPKKYQDPVVHMKKNFDSERNVDMDSLEKALLQRSYKIADQYQEGEANNGTPRL